MDLKTRVSKIETRNKRVEADKAWEISWTRRLLIAVATYFTIVIFLLMINAPNPMLNAAIPASAYFISTLTLPPIKQLWARYINKK